jgi:hypothetical protein
MVGGAPTLARPCDLIVISVGVLVRPAGWGRTGTVRGVGNPSQYVSQSRKIAAGDTDSIRDRWKQGLRLLHDRDHFAAGSSQLRPGSAARLVDAHAKRGVKISERELRYRIQCARAYKTETEFGNAVAEFPTWHDLVQAGFPPFPGLDGEPPADWRTAQEIRHDRARQLAAHADQQGVLFPLDQFEPVQSSVKELLEYTEQGEELTARFAAHDRKRRAYVDALVEVSGGDLSLTWQEAHDRLAPTVVERLLGEHDGLD